jgi:hypothetical protein
MMLAQRCEFEQGPTRPKMKYGIEKENDGNEPRHFMKFLSRILTKDL